ncbi:MAG: nucleotidyltransferase domain-containing protein [Bacteroidia bacterium]
MLSSIISNNINQITALCKQHHVKELYVFGSAARNEMNDESDVDFLYTMQEIPLEEYADNSFEMEESLEKLLDRKVDLVAEKYLRNRFFIKELNETKQLIYKV